MSSAPEIHAYIWGLGLHNLQPDWFTECFELEGRRRREQFQLQGSCLARIFPLLDFRSHKATVR